MSDLNIEGLGFGITSDYYNKAQHFNPEEKETIKIFVESDDDKKLWLGVFGTSTENYMFDITSAFDFSISLPEGENKVADGCTKLSKMLHDGIIQLGRNCILCLDSDFSYISSNYNHMNRSYLKNEFVYETIVHSKESIFLNCENIKEKLGLALGCNLENEKIDIISIINKISLAYGELLERVLIFYKEEYADTFKYFIEKINESLFDIVSSIRFEDDYDSEIKVKLDSLLSSVLDEVRQFCQKTNMSKNPVLAADIIENKDFFKKNAYLFIRGHNLDKILSKLFKLIEYEIYKRKKDKIYSANVSEQVKREKCKALNNAKLEIKSFLVGCVDYKNIPFFSKTVYQLKEIYKLP